MAQFIMPRFSIRTLLIAFAVVAVWFSTFAWKGTPFAPTPGPEIRRIIFLGILIASGSAAVYLHGRRRAFWSGFFVTMLLLSYTRQPSLLIPNLDILTFAVIQFLPASVAVDPITVTALHALLLLISATMGFIATWIYDQGKGTRNG